MVEVLIRRDQGTTPSKPNNTTEKVAPELLLGELIRYTPRNVGRRWCTVRGHSMTKQMSGMGTRFATEAHYLEH